MKKMRVGKQQGKVSTQHSGLHPDMMLESSTPVCCNQLDVSTFGIPTIRSPATVQGTKCATAIKMSRGPREATGV